MTTVISIISYPFLPAKVGGQKGVALFNAYFGRYVNLVCVTTRKNDPREAKGYELLNILSDSLLRYINPFYFFKVRKIIKQKKATFLLLEHPYYGWLGILLKWFCGIRLIVHSHNIEGLRWKAMGKWWWPILWRYEQFTHRQADFNFFIHDEDREYAIREFGLRPEKCITMTYGIEWDRIPTAERISACREEIRTRYQAGPGETLLFFNGAFNYRPNLKALRIIMDTLNPLLQEQTRFLYKIIICGRDIPAEISNQKLPNLIFAGFVDDIDSYFQGTDIFLNPITEGGGIKTKLVEALGNNLNAVSTRTGAIGIDPSWCNGKLLLCEDGDWVEFVNLILQASSYKADIPKAYFDQFYWVNTTKRAAGFIQGKIAF